MNNEKIAKRLRDLRGSRSQKQVSDDLNITPSSLSNYEAGTRVPRDRIKKKIADYYGVKVDSIFFDD